MSTVPWKTIGRLSELFTSLDSARGIPAEQQWTLQVLKIAEEVGESAQAVIGAWATNPRKGQSHTWQHVQEEVADTAITSLVTLHRMLGDEAPAFFEALLAQKAARFLALSNDNRATPRRDVSSVCGPAVGHPAKQRSEALVAGGDLRLLDCQVAGALAGNGLRARRHLCRGHRSCFARHSAFLP